MAGLDRIATRATTEFFSALSKCVTRSGGPLAENQPASFRKDSARKLQGGIAGRPRTAARILCGPPDDKFQAAAEALRVLPFSPSRATFAQFLEQTHVALAHLGWKQHALEMANAAHDWSRCLDEKFPRALFLRWLEETATTSDAERSAAGDHPYARVQLLTVARAQNQEWSHLIFAGWNEGAWPPPAGAEFARDEEIHAFNRSVQQLNKRAARQGSQGEGHTSVSENHSLYLGPIEQRAIALRQFDALLESASEGVTLTASLLQEDAPNASGIRANVSPSFISKRGVSRSPRRR